MHTEVFPEDRAGKTTWRQRRVTFRAERTASVKGLKAGCGVAEDCLHPTVSLAVPHQLSASSVLDEAESATTVARPGFSAA
jgi:hypothetical protein